jgi:vancomycin resistance protein YoaR
MQRIIHNLLLPLAIILLIVTFFVVLDIINYQKINYGIKISGISVGGLSEEDALNKFNITNQSLFKTDFNLIYKNSVWTVNLKNLGVEINASETINSAYAYGHQKNKLFKNVWQQLKSFLGYNFKSINSMDDDKLEKFFEENLYSIHRPAKNSLLVYDKKTQDFTITPPTSGVIIDKDKFKKDLIDIINNSKIKNINISLINDRPTVTESEAKKSIPEAKKLLENTPIIIMANQKEIDKIDTDTLLSLMDPVPSLQADKIENYLIFLSPLVVQEPVDAQLTVLNNRVTQFALSQEGVKLEIKDNIDILKNGILNGQKEINLKTNNVKPKISAESIDNLGITSFLAKGVSNFSGSSGNRITNIRIGAARFNGVLIKPNEEFSFDTLLGDVGPEQGYKPGLVIKENSMVPEYGGGLCQVSTTAFRVAVNSGMEITQRYPHAFAVHYYNPQGFDATIYPPSPDLRFINNTSGYILIQTKVRGNELIFEFYGTDDGRRVEVIGPEQYDFQPDGAMKAKLTQRVYDKNNNIIIDKTFYSNYKSPSLYPEEVINPLQ